MSLIDIFTLLDAVIHTITYNNFLSRSNQNNSSPLVERIQKYLKTDVLEIINLEHVKYIELCKQYKNNFSSLYKNTIKNNIYYNQKDDTGNDSLYYAMRHNLYKIVKHLIKHVNIKLYFINFAIKQYNDYMNVDIMEFAMKQPNMYIFIYLLKKYKLHINYKDFRSLLYRNMNIFEFGIPNYDPLPLIQNRHKVRYIMSNYIKLFVIFNDKREFIRRDRDDLRIVSKYTAMIYFSGEIDMFTFLIQMLI